MAEWVLIEEAVQRVRVRTGLIVATAPQELLIRAIRSGLVETVQGPNDPVSEATNSWIINADSLDAWINDFMGVGPKVEPKVPTAAKVSNRPPVQREAAKAILRMLPATTLQGKRAALLAEVNQRLDTAISMDTLRRALDEI